MNRRAFLKASACAALPSLLPGASRAQPRPAATWPFFAFDNGVGRGDWPPERQAETLKELGYDGISYNYTHNRDLETWIRVYREAGLRIFGLYVHAFPEKTDEPWSPALREAVSMLKGSGTALWTTFREAKVQGDYDAACVRIARELGDLAQGAGVQVVIYPHVNFYIETASDALRIARLANHPAVKPSYNLCHEFLAGKGAGAMDALRAVASEAALVSINGVDPADRQRFILRLGEGAFDMAAFLAELRRLGYIGPVGHQFYGIPGDAKENLKAAITAWRALQPG